MPDLYNQDIKPEQPKPDPNEEEVVRKLFEYVSPTMNPWRATYMATVAECANFKELRQWTENDKTLLGSLEVPAVPVDRINRGLDTISGIREQSNNKRAVVPRESGDNRIADVLDHVCDQAAYDGSFDQVADEAFESMRDYGIGIRKLGFDPQGNSGMGELWAEACNVEDVWWGKCKRKDLSDAPWIAHLQLMDWEDAMALAPNRASEIKGLQTQAVAEWEKMKGNVKTDSSTRDYQSESADANVKFQYPHQVYVWEFWIKKRTLLKRISSVETMEIPNPILPEAPARLPVAKVRTESGDYQPQEGESVVQSYVQNSYVQYVVATNRERSGGIILSQAEDFDHPFVGEMAERKKSGAPRGYIEIVIPHQQRVNLAWAQKVAYNNKSIKSPLILKNAQSTDLSTITQHSHFGTVLMLPPGADLVGVNTQPNVNLQAIEEGNVARADMDFAAAATEEALRGVSGADVSGIKFSLQQHAATVPLNKYAKAEQVANVTFWRKVLKLICRYYKQPAIERILGRAKFQELIVGPLDPVTQQPMLPPLQFPMDINVVDYDVEVVDQAVSDFNRQQSFNAVEALQQSGIPFDPEFRIKNAPIKDVDAAIDAYRQARMDVLRMVVAQNQMLMEENNALKKQAGVSRGPNRDASQPANARAGANASQSGQRSMVGGQAGLP